MFSFISYLYIYLISYIYLVVACCFYNKIGSLLILCLNYIYCYLHVYNACYLFMIFILNQYFAKSWIFSLFYILFVLFRLKQPSILNEQ